MEDISRELEREIARAKPTPYKTNKKKNVLVVNDFGEMKSGRYLWVLVRLLSVTSLVFGVAAAGLYYAYTHQVQRLESMEKRLVLLEKKKNQLVNEKEILMAQLVMAGDKPALAVINDTVSSGKTIGVKTEKSEAKISPQQSGDSKLAQKNADQQVESEFPAPAAKQADETPAASSDMDDGEEIATEGVADTSEGAETGDEPVAYSARSEVIAVEKFAVSQNSAHDELRVKFNIRNIKEGPGEISGRIFLVLKPEGGGKSDWIVAPKAPLGQNGVPSVYKRGQYFSISRFKPVQFTINSKIPPERLKMTGVFIFNDQGQLIFNDMVETGLDEEP